MLLPILELPSDSTLFDEGFRRFVQQRFPSFMLYSDSYGSAVRYAIQHEGQTIAEIETLPINGRNQPDRLEIRVASLNQRWQQSDGENLIPSTPWFCGAFYQWAQERYGIELRSPDPIFKDMAGYVAAQEFFQGAFASWEEVQFDDTTMEELRQAVVNENRTGLLPIPNQTNRESTAGKPTQLTLKDWVEYRPSAQEQENEVATGLARLRYPYTGERKELGRVVCYIVKRGDVELGRILINSYSLFPGFDLNISGLRDDEIRKVVAQFHSIYDPIIQQIRFLTRTNKEVGLRHHDTVASAESLDSILCELRALAIAQGEMQRTLDAIRRVLKHLQRTGLPIDSETKKSLDEIYKAVNPNLDFEQGFEISLPIIPLLLQYKIALNGRVDLGAAGEELKKRIQKKRGGSANDSNAE